MIAKLKKEFPGTEILTEAAELEHWGRDWTRFYAVNGSGVVFPKTIDEISSLLKFCNSHQIAVVPSGGRTGLSAGAVAHQGELVMNLSKMNKILQWDPLSLTLHVEAGVVHETVQEYLKPLGFHWPVDLASKGSCQIGGNLATNAGGLRVIRYGHARRWVQSMTVVLADGRVMELNGALEKNNTGPCLRDVVVGSEGTLAVIATARLKVLPLPKFKSTILSPVTSVEEGLQILRQLRSAGMPILAFEFIQANCLDRVLERTGLKAPFSKKNTSAVLFDLELENLDKLPSGLSLDEHTVVAQSPEASRNLWAYRENITESLAHLGFVYKHDLAFPIDKIPQFLASVQKEFPQRFPGAELYLFGHLGDGNMHVNIVYRRVDGDGSLLAQCEKNNDWIFTQVKAVAGSISAEHGLGLLKRKYVHYSKSRAEIEILQGLRKIMDPNGILNPGKGI